MIVRPATLSRVLSAHCVTYILLASCAVVVLVLYGLEEVHTEDLSGRNGAIGSDKKNYELHVNLLRSSYGVLHSRCRVIRGTC